MNLPGPESAGPESAGPESAGPESAGPESAGPESAGDAHSETSGQHEQRRRLDEIFGDVLPSRTRDDRDPGERSGMGRDWYDANRPPPHPR